MHYRFYIFTIITSLLLFIACSSPESKNNNKTTSNLHPNFTKTEVRYSKHFSIHYTDSFKIVHIYKDEYRKDTLNSFILLPYNTTTPSQFNKLKAINIPLQKVACLSSLYVAFLEQLGLLDKLTAVDNSKYIYSKTLRNFIEQKKIQEVGNNNSVNFEQLALISPDAVFTYWEQGLIINSKLNELNIAPIFIVDHLEESPLGRTEWIKLMAALFNEEEKANIFFDTVEQKYNSLIYSVSDKAQIVKPSVLVGTKLSDAWYIPGGQSFMATLINDAGGDYIWKTDSTSGSIALDFETVLEKAKNVDVWLNVYQCQKIDDLINQDKRYNYFNALVNKKIYNNNARVNEYGGNDFWESGLLNPQLLLSDLLKIFHPEMLEGYETKYYKKLE